MDNPTTFIIPTIGTRGDVQPYIALAQGLLARGHAVTVATHPCMRALVEGYGVLFAPIGPDIDVGREAAAIRARSPHWMVGFMRVMRFSFAMLEQSHADLLARCSGIDTVIVSHTAAGSIEADALGLPTVSVTLMPQAIPRPKLKVDVMADAFREMHAPEMRQKAAKLGERLRSEPDSVTEAVRLIEDCVQTQETGEADEYGMPSARGPTA